MQDRSRAHQQPRSQLLRAIRTRASGRLRRSALGRERQFADVQGSRRSPRGPLPANVSFRRRRRIHADGQLQSSRMASFGVVGKSDSTVEFTRLGRSSFDRQVAVNHLEPVNLLGQFLDLPLVTIAWHIAIQTNRARTTEIRVGTYALELISALARLELRREVFGRLIGDIGSRELLVDARVTLRASGTPGRAPRPAKCSRAIA
jgi:hypothetical protein